MEAKKTRVASEETRPDAGTYVSPEIQAAEAGEQAEFGTTIVPAVGQEADEDATLKE